MPRTEEQFEKIRERKKALILNKALELFATNGYYPTSINMIAKEAGISKGLIYNYFDSKEDLIREIMMVGFEKFVVGFDPDKDGILTCEEFEFFVRETFRVLKENTPFYKLYFSTMMQPRVFELVQGRVQELIPKYLKILVSYYDRLGVAQPATEAMIFGAMMDGISMNYIMDPENFPAEKAIQSIIDKFGHCKKE